MQQELWHDEFEDALWSVCEALNPKTIGHEMFPEKSPVEAAKVLARCLSVERSEKLSAGQIALILKRGREAGVHIGMAYLTQTCGYADPQPLDPEDEKARLQREYVESVQVQQGLVKRLEALKT